MSIGPDAVRRAATTAPKDAVTGQTLEVLDPDGGWVDVVVGVMYAGGTRHPIRAPNQPLRVALDRLGRLS